MNGLIISLFIKTEQSFFIKKKKISQFQNTDFFKIFFVSYTRLLPAGDENRALNSHTLTYSLRNTAFIKTLAFIKYWYEKNVGIMVLWCCGTNTSVLIWQLRGKDVVMCFSSQP